MIDSCRDTAVTAPVRRARVLLLRQALAALKRALHGPAVPPAPAHG